MIWANLLHLSFNMWHDVPAAGRQHFTEGAGDAIYYSDELLLDDAVWRDVTEQMSRSGFNAVLLDLGDAIAYRSHPEIAVRGA